MPLPQKIKSKLPTRIREPTSISKAPTTAALRQTVVSDVTASSSITQSARLGLQACHSSSQSAGASRDSASNTTCPSVQGGIRPKIHAVKSAKEIQVSPELPLEVRLHDWAINEMGMQPRGKYFGDPVPMPEELKHMCLSIGTEIWEHVIKHVKSERTIQIMKKTTKKAKRVKLGIAQDGAKGPSELRTEMEKLSLEIVAKKEKCQAYKEYAKILKNSLRQTEETVAKEEAHILELKQSIAALRDYKQKTESQCLKLQELSTTLNAWLKKILGQAANTTEALHSKGKDQLLLGTLQEAHQLADKLYHHASGDSSFEGKAEDLQQQFWTTLELAIEINSSSAIMEAMNQIAEAHVQDAKKLTEDVNIIQDAQELRSRFQQVGGSTELQAAAAIPSESMEELIQNLRIEHIQLCADAVKLKDEIEQNKEGVKEVVDAINNHLPVLFPDSETALLVRATILQEGCAVLKEGYVESLKATLKELQEEDQQLCKKHDAINVLQGRLANLKEKGEKAQVLVNTFLHQNMELPNKLQETQEEIKKFIKHNMFNRRMEIEGLLKSMQYSITEEVQLFQNLNLSNLWNVTIESLERFPVKDLDIYQFNFVLNKEFENILKELQFHSHLGVEQLVPLAVTLRNETKRCQQALEQAQFSVGNLVQEQMSVSSERVVDALAIVQQIRKELTGQIPRLQQQNSKVHNSAIYEELKHATDIWWKQPAQYIKCGITVNGYLFVQWMQQWMKIYSQHR